MDKSSYIKIGTARDLREKQDRRLYRALEILPGFLSWITIIGMFLASWQYPVAAALFIIVFDVYWFFKTLFLSLHLRHAFRELRRVEQTSWQEKLREWEREHDMPEAAGIGAVEEMFHLVIIPFYQESYEVISGSVRALADANYDTKKLIVVLSGEERAGEHGREILRAVEDEFAESFGHFLTTLHPADIPNELAGKGANETWAARQVKQRIIDPEAIPYTHILTTVLDADTQIGADYFARLMYVYVNADAPQRASYQPVPLFTNNIYEASSFARVISYSATFWHLMQQSRPERLTTFSSHSMPFQSLVDIDFWQTNIVSEDSRIFWQCYLFYDGDWRVEPLYYPVSMDANVAPSFWKTVVNQYKQQRRWGYGVENLPYLFFAFTKNKQIAFSEKLKHAAIKLEAFHSWATNALMIFLMGWLPLLLGGDAFKFSLLSFNLPEITRWILTFASLGIVTSAFLSVVMLPARRQGIRWWYRPLYLLQWVLLPAVLIFFGAFPGLEAQTRLMLGKYMGFWFTPKHRIETMHVGAKE